MKKGFLASQQRAANMSPTPPIFRWIAPYGTFINHTLVRSKGNVGADQSGQLCISQANGANVRHTFPMSWLFEQEIPFARCQKPYLRQKVIIDSQHLLQSLSICTKWCIEWRTSDFALSEGFRRSTTIVSGSFDAKKR